MCVVLQAKGSTCPFEGGQPLCRLSTQGAVAARVEGGACSRACLERHQKIPEALQQREWHKAETEGAARAGPEPCQHALPSVRASTAPGGQRQRSTWPSSGPQGRTPEEHGQARRPRPAVQPRPSWRHAALPCRHAIAQKGPVQGPRPPARRPHTACQGHGPLSAAPCQARRPATAAAGHGTRQGHSRLGAVQKQSAADARWLSQLWAEHGSRLQLHRQVWTVLDKSMPHLPRCLAMHVCCQVCKHTGERKG